MSQGVMDEQVEALSASTHLPASEETERLPWSQQVGTSPLLWGLAATVLFYVVIPYLPIQQEFIARYFAGHWIEYATTGLCFLGLAILVKKASGLVYQNGIFTEIPLRHVRGESPLPLAERVSQTLRSTAKLPRRLRKTWLTQRVNTVCQYILGRGNSDGLEEHLKYQAELAGESLHSSYALVRTVTWAIPILGFLGTVIGITMAIANVTPEQLESSLGEVTAGLAVAFDTTALSLALSMVLVFATFLVERSEHALLARVERYGIQTLLPLLSQPAVPQSPFAQAETQAADELWKRSTELISWQTGLWQSSLETLRGKWLDSAEQQQSQFAQALQQGMSASLTQHTQQLAEFRHQFVDVFRQAADELSKMLAGTQQAVQSQQEQTSRQVAEVWQQVQVQLVALREEQRGQTEQLLRLLASASQNWHQNMTAATETLGGQLRELHQQGEVLRTLTAQEDQLIRLQSTMQNNLQSLRAVEVFEETLHSLTAAVHLLTVRAHSRAA